MFVIGLILLSPATVAEEVSRPLLYRYIEVAGDTSRSARDRLAAYRAIAALGTPDAFEFLAANERVGVYQDGYNRLPLKETRPCYWGLRCTPDDRERQDIRVTRAILRVLDTPMDEGQLTTFAGLMIVTLPDESPARRLAWARRLVDAELDKEPDGLRRDNLLKMRSVLAKARE